MVEHIVFWDYLDADGWGECTSMHRSGHRLAPEAVALGVTIAIPQKLQREGWLTKPWVHPATPAFEWRMTRDDRYRVPISEFLSYLPAMTRVQARAARAADPVVADFLTLLEMASTEGRGINPHGAAARQGLAYLVSKGWLTQAEADVISDAANDPA